MPIEYSTAECPLEVRRREGSEREAQAGLGKKRISQTRTLWVPIWVVHGPSLHWSPPNHTKTKRGHSSRTVKGYS